MESFWTGKRVVVTGGAGFVGSHLVEALVEAYSIVTVMDDFSRGFTRIDDARYICCDSGELSLESGSCDVFFNLAASVAGVIYNQSHQLEMFGRNMRLQTEPVISAEKANVKHFLQVSSVCVYAPECQDGSTEDTGHWGEPVFANAGYSWSKRMGERTALWSGIPNVVIVRPTNMYGPRDYFDDRAHVIPALIRKCTEDEVIEVHGSGREVREFLYVKDAVRGMMLAVEHGEHRGVYNLGTHGSNKISISDLVTMIQSITGTLNKRVIFVGGDGGDSRRWSNCLRARDALGFYADTLLEDGLRETIEWYTREKVIT